MRTGLAIYLGIVMLALASAVVVGGQQQPRPLDAKVAQAWREAGAKIGWMVEYEDGTWLFFEERPSNKKRILPALQIDSWRAGVIEKLPRPEVPFGLALLFTDFPDAGLKELAQLSHLEILDLLETRLTEAGLKELGTFTQLRKLRLGAVPMDDPPLIAPNSQPVGGGIHRGRLPITDARLQELVHLRRLQALDLEGTEITDAGFKELRLALQGCHISMNEL
jgi:hypothetical protein